MEPASPYTAASDFDAPLRRHRRFPGRNTTGPRYGYGPSLLPSTEVYAVLRDNGFSPLGIPRLRGFVYTIAVIDRGGEDGRLIIDARNGRIIRFMPAYRMGGDNYNEEQSAPRALHGSAAAGPGAQAHRRRTMSRPHRSRHGQAPCREPHGADAEGQSARRQARYARPVKQAAAPAPKPAEVAGGRRR